MQDIAHSDLWSDDCLSCLCGLPHTWEYHVQQLEQARLALQEEREALADDLWERWNEDEDEEGQETTDQRRKGEQPHGRKERHRIGTDVTSR